MGFAGMAALTHEMEDVFELLRQRRGGLGARRDRRAAAVPRRPRGRRRRDRHDRLRADQPGAADRAAARCSCATTPPKRPRPPSRRIEPPADLGEMAQGRRVVQVAATLNDDVSMPSVRAYMVLAALASLGETLACIPTPDDVEGFQGREVVAWLVSDRTDAELMEVAAAVPEVADAQAIEAVPDAAVDGEPETPVGRDARRPPRGQLAQPRLLDRPRRRRAPGPADARDGRARPQPHPGRGARRQRRRPGPGPGHPGPDPHLARPAGDGHAGPHDPGRGRAAALPAARARPLRQALQAGRARAHRQGHRARPLASSTRSATRSCT